jgi:hypothetical protein
MGPATTAGMSNGTEARMTERLDEVPTNEFVAIWNAAWSLDDVVAGVQDRVGPVPRWAVIARAAALRKEGADLKRFTTRSDR